MVEKATALERRSRQGLVIAVCSIIFEIVGQIGAAISAALQLSAASVIISNVPSLIGVALAAIATIISTAVIICELYSRAKNKKRNNTVFANSTSALSMVVLYILIWWLITYP